MPADDAPPPTFGEWRKLHPAPTADDVIARLKAVNEFASRHPEWFDQNIAAIRWECETLEAWAADGRIPAWVQTPPTEPPRE